MMRAFRSLLTLYSPRYPRVIIYMLQGTEYEVMPYLKWFWRTQDFSRVIYRRQLVETRAARLLHWALTAGIALQLIIAVTVIVLHYTNGLVAGDLFGLALIVSYPVVWAHLITVPLLFGRYLIAEPKARTLIAQSTKTFADHPGVRIAVAGSYGKTSMKELLLTVLSAGTLKVAATPANKNVAISHALFANKLTGDEDILIIEYGEGAPGDVARFAAITQPTHAIITGLAPAHLDKYKTLEAAGKDIFSLADYLHGKHVYVNAESPAIKPFLKNDYATYSAAGTLGWRVSQIYLTAQATSFELTKGKQQLKLTSGLLGVHQVGPLSLAAALAKEFGLSDEQVTAGIAAVQPYEHRMQPYHLSGASIIDDTYNGNIEGVRVGTELLKALPAKRKLYVTPGLVDQGKETKPVHIRMGELIAAAQPDVVILMANSATPYIRHGLEQAHYSGEVRVEHEPLDFYLNLDQHVAAGDLVLMQNDWTDNYA